jgi:hypothetical protein
MTIEGELVVRLAWNGSRVSDVAIRSSRPLAVPSVLAGRTVDEASAIVPRLYSVCATAQGAAASAALQCAVGLDPTPSMRSVAPAIVAEAIQEQLRRLLIDLPALVDLAPAVEPVASARRAIAPLLADGSATLPADVARVVSPIVERHLFAMPASAWLAQSSVDDVRAWARRGETPPAKVVARWLAGDASLGASDVAPMPAADRAVLEEAVLAPLGEDPAFAAAPRWRGAPVETGPWARAIDHPLVAACTRSFGNGVVARTIARITTVAQDLGRLMDDAGDAIDGWSPRAGEGASRVETARGMLVHLAQVEGGRVARYAIVAPTEWNFHPDGALARGLARLEDPDAASLRGRAGQVVQALDPCVACRVEVIRA